MKTLMIVTLLIATNGFAQTLDVKGLKSLLTARQTLLETVKQGMSKKIVNVSQIQLEQGICDYTVTSVQTIMKIETTRMIVHTSDKYSPAASATCTAAGYQTFEENILFYADKPSLTGQLADIDQSAASIKGISKDKEIITMNLEFTGVDSQTNQSYVDKMITKFDLSKPAFKSMVLTQGEGYKMDGVDQADVNVNTINLKDVLFCADNDGDNSECSQGDYSDILF